MKLVSFDIFDTTLIRKCGCADNVQWILAKKLFPNDEARQMEFYAWRRKSVKEQVNINYSLFDIYNTCGIEAFSPYTRQSLMNAERSVESDMLVGNPSIINIIRDYREKGWKVVFISDMYLDGKLLKEVLIREGAMEPSDTVFVSNEYAARKDGGGNLYDIVRLRMKPHKWIHYGDNRSSDYKIASSKGIKSKWIEHTYTPVELDVYRESEYSLMPYELATLAGISRAARIKNGNSPKTTLAADYLASAYIPYVIHVLRDAAKRKITKLVFLSRDAYILKIICDDVIRNGNTKNIETSFLFVSRKSLLLPFLVGEGAETFLRYHRGSLLGESWKDLIDELEVSLEDLKSNRESFNFTTIRSKQQEEFFLRVLFKTPLYSIWQTKAKLKLDNTIGYLRQEHVLTGDGVAFVDVGWVGTTRMMINCLRRKFGNSSAALFYYFNIFYNPIDPTYGEYDCYNKSLYPDSTIINIVEDYFSLCPYPSTIGYLYNDMQNKYSPIYENKKFGNKDFLDVNILVCKSMVSMICEIGFSSYALYEWMNRSIKSLQSFRHKVDYSPLLEIHMKNQPLVKRLSFAELFKILVGREVSAIYVASLDITIGIYLRKRLMKIRRIIIKSGITNILREINWKLFKK